MKRPGKLLLGILGAMLVLVAVAIGVVATFDWNRAKPWFAATVSQALDRSLTIEGDLNVQWRRDADLGGWRAWLPTPHVSAGQVVVGNPPGTRGATFVKADRVEFDIAVLPLLSHTVSIEALRFVDADASLERLADGRDNWTFTVDQAQSPWTFDLGRITLDRSRFTYFDPARAIDVKGDIAALGESIGFDRMLTQQVRQTRHDVLASIGAKGIKRFEERADRRAERERRSGRVPQRYAFSWTAEGSYQHESFKATGKAGGVFFLRDPDHPFPLQADARIGATRIAFVGTLTDPLDLDSLDLRLWLAGPNLSQLYDIARITLPNSPPYAMEGRLVGQFRRGAKKLRYEEFTARIGQSDASGTLEYESRAPRPLLSGNVDSDEMQFRDLAPLIGAHVNDGKAATAKVLPMTPFRPQRWRAMDADVHFTGDHVFRDSELPIHKVDTRIVMNDAVLALEPLKFRYAWGDVDATLRFDGRSAPIKATMNLSARGMQLEHMLAGVAGDQATLGTAGGEARLTATGDSIGTLLGATNGELKLLLDSGTVSKGLLETAGLNVPNIIVTKLFGDRQVKIDCGAADLVASGGVFEARTFVVDTDVARIDVSGSIDLGREWVDLVVHPRSKGVRLFSLRSPIHVQGPFKDIDASIDKGALLARAASAIGLAFVATPVAAMVPLTSTNLGAEGNHCLALLGEPPKARPPAPAKKRS